MKKNSKERAFAMLIWHCNELLFDVKISSGTQNFLSSFSQDDLNEYAGRLATTKYKEFRENDRCFLEIQEIN